MKRRFILWGLATIAVLIALLASATMLITYTDRAFICENTGSHMGYREWFFGSKTNEWYQKSELESFLEEEYPEKIIHRWTSYAGDGHSLIPGMRSAGHGRPGPMLELDHIILDKYVLSLTNPQKLDLYKSFCSANEAEVRSRVEAIQEDSP